ncbi:methyl-accepting chemotaxis protein [Halomonas daqiaonensis]|uniref:Methyl-accepting chemotaxis sensory transducer with TarH sensor n=1 Tax=Halomonas daqiaonensis TaxID=650850 RepID=A0A1H7SRV8_9GAMM|nr:PAS domain-containing methyl-accepting chemotaxis protein [Halomonas daqiaonensis]SEL75311.1 methyl-accepting chemotaxis sensory transducer with TarH sensor [Halomonas daqiaonensis]
MRNNQPVTQQEYPLHEEHFLISRTDLKGRITYVNPAFIEVSGFSREELLGSPHNIVRHPDMPEAAYQNLWDTLAAGESWKGLVKNRRKNGDHYWVDASVSPIVEEDRLVGYASVRVKPDPIEVDKADKAYALINKGKGSRFTLERGQLRRRGLGSRLSRLNLRSLRARVVTMVVVAGLLLLASGALGLFGLQVSGERLQALDRDGLQDVARLQQIDQLATRAHQSLSRNDRFMLLENKDQHLEELQEIESSLDTLWTTYRAREANQNGQADTFDSLLTDYLDAGIGRAINLLQSDENFDIFTNLPPHNEEMQAMGETLSTEVNDLIEGKQANAATLADEARAEQQRMLMAQAGMLAIGLLVLIVIGALTLRAMLRPLRDAEAFTLQIASGNLAADVPARRRDELGRLLEALDIMRKSLGSIVGDVNSGIRVVTPAARDIASGNEDLSARTEQQAASLQQTASSMEEMTTTVQHNSENARQASGLASENAARTRETGELMHQVVGTMGEITQGSRKMTEIINVIDSIAFQTNILALNASVEAARAGEQGRGFAVVAGEVRKLAGRSADAASEIRELIDDSSRQIDGGAELVRQAETSLDAVMEASTRVNDIMGEITAASEEQSNGIGQINQAVVEMDQVTQQNAARVQASARAASELEQQASLLGNAISAFRLRGAGMEQAPSLAKRQARHQAPDDSPGPAASHHESSPGTLKGEPRQATAVEEWEAF